MVDDKIIDLDKKLRGQTYGEISKALKSESLSVDELFELIESKSIKVGDSATSFLSKKDVPDEIVRRLTGNRIRTIFGKMRALSIIDGKGNRYPGALAAYLHCLNDRSDRVAAKALFGLAFLQRNEILPELSRLKQATAAGSYRYNILQKAIESLEQKNPYIFSPHFGGGASWGIDGSLRGQLKQP